MATRFTNNKKAYSLRNLISWDSSSDSDDSCDASLSQDDATSSCYPNCNGSCSVDETDEESTSQRKNDTSELDLLLLDMGLDDLPLLDLGSLNIDYDSEKFMKMGHVRDIIDTMVTIDALSDTPTYDLNTVLFVEHQSRKKPLGVIFDVYGPVRCPTYCVNFKNKDELEKTEVKIGMPIYSAPKNQVTRYVLVKELIENKGTVASWLRDAEPPSDEESPEEEIIQEKPKITGEKRGSLNEYPNSKRQNTGTELHSMAADLSTSNMKERSKDEAIQQTPKITGVKRGSLEEYPRSKRQNTGTGLDGVAAGPSN